MQVVLSSWLFCVGGKMYVNFPGAIKLKECLTKKKPSEDNWDTFEVHVRKSDIGKYKKQTKWKIYSFLKVHK